MSKLKKMVGSWVCFITRRHKLKIVERSEVNFICTRCGEKFVVWLDRENPIELMHPDVPKLFKEIFMSDSKMFDELGEVYTNSRGFECILFEDSYKKRCILQESSTSEPHVWLGIDGNRMHLSRKQVEALVAHLKNWLETGSFHLSVKKISVEYTVNDQKDMSYCFDVSSAFILKRGNYALAQLAAKDFFAHHEGYKFDWPVTITIENVEGRDNFESEKFRVYIDEDYKYKVNILDVIKDQ